jgi:hypothetical protein
MPAFFRIVLLLVAIGTQSRSEAQTPSQPELSLLSVEEMVIAKNVEKLKPIGVSHKFPSSVGTLFCFTKITGAQAERKVHHLWFYGDRLVQEVLLPVKGASWRTYSLRPIPAERTGSWRVDITMEDGTLLKSVSFTIQ